MDLLGDILLPGTLWLIMYSMGLSLTPADFRRVFTNARALAVGIGSILIAVPLIGTLAAIAFAPTPELAVGFVLLATCPGGMLSNLMTDIAKGNLALSLSLTLIVSLVYVLVVPFYAYGAVLYFLGTEATVSIPFLDYVWKILSITLIPVGLGLITRYYVEPLAKAIKSYIKLFATLVLVIVFLFILSDQVEVFRENAGTLLLMVGGMNVFAIIWALFISKVARLEFEDRTAICIEHLIRQEGTAMYIAVSILGSSQMSLPMIINTPVALALCILFVLSVRTVKPSVAKLAA
jgi:bile acid:Na+ symporter, BASS family